MAQPHMTRELNLIALPALLGDLPPPLRQIVGIFPMPMKSWRSFVKSDRTKGSISGAMVSG